MLARCGICKKVNRRMTYVACDCPVTIRRWTVRPLKKGTIVCLQCAYSLDIPIVFEMPDTSDGEKLFTQQEVKKAQMEAVSRYQRLRALLSTDGKLGPIQQEIRTGKRSFRAQYIGLCVNCGRKIEVGQRIFFFSGKGVWHDNCGIGLDGTQEVYDADLKPDILPTTGRKFRLVR